MFVAILTNDHGNMQNYTLKEDYIHLIQLLKAMNWVETGGQAQIVVMDGLVRHNGQTDYRKRLKVRKGDVVEFDGQMVKIV